MTRASCIPAGGCWHCELSCQPFVSCSASPFRRRPISSAAAFAASAPRAASPGWAPCPAAEAPGSAPGGWPWRRQRWVMLEDWRSNKKAVTLARGAPPAVASSHRGHHHPVSSSPEERKKVEKKKKKTLNDSKQTEPAPRQTTSCQLQTSDSVGKKNRNQGRVFIVGATPDRCENKDPSCLKVMILFDIILKLNYRLLSTIIDQRSQSYCFYVWWVLLLQQLEQHISGRASVYLLKTRLF